MGSSHSCPRINTTIPENGSQWSLSNGEWDNVKLGWLVAGIATLLTTAICMFAAYNHGRHYHRPKEQRQIIRILWMPLVFAIISFFSYRYYRSYVYYKLIFIVYEALCLMAFLALMLAYVGNSTEEQMAVMQSKDKRPLPWPMGCLRYRPSKPYFLYALNLSVLQYAFLRPLLSVIAMICHHAGLLCPNELSPFFAYLYLEVIDFVSISIALYGLVVMYSLAKPSLQGKRPLMKFMLIKVIVALTYYQAFIFSALVRQGILKPNRYWSKTNIADGLNAIVICVEMVVFAGLMLWAYPVAEYRRITSETTGECTSHWKAFGQALNFWDFVAETWKGVVFLIKGLHPRKRTGEDGNTEAGDRPQGSGTNLDIYAAFNAPRRRQSAYPVKREIVDLSRAPIRALHYSQPAMFSRAGSLEDGLAKDKEESLDAGLEPDNSRSRELHLPQPEGRWAPGPPLPEYRVQTIRRDSSMLARTAPGAAPFIAVTGQPPYSQQRDHTRAQAHRADTEPVYTAQAEVQESVPPASARNEQANVTPARLQGIQEVSSPQEREDCSQKHSETAPARDTLDLTAYYSSQSDLASPIAESSQHANASGLPVSSLVSSSSRVRLDERAGANKASNVAVVMLQDQDVGSLVEMSGKASNVEDEVQETENQPLVLAEPPSLHEPLTFSPIKW
ncbi:DUF300-domain-containing protein [Cystobasidium minutum MCA 4210]|uniref:DUF300-domain-containing protein n=1 Tax=Cystobasidium minutum MCA 4210 TaxID=1397322 RepID=UPI0034CFD6D5|eukprot:jgi/Rhomi1/5365/CE5364_531